MKNFILLITCVLTHEFCHGQSFINASLELWSVPSTCQTNTPPDSWNNYSNVGLGPDEGNLTLCASTIPPVAADGDTYARCLAGNPNTGEGMYQIVSGFTAGMSYTIEYKYCGSNLWGGSGDCVWHLFIDDIDVNQSAVFSSADVVWHTNYYSFTATAATHKIGVRAYTPTYNGGGSAGIDYFNIKLSKSTGIGNNSIATDVSVYPNPFENILTVKSNENQSVKTFTLIDIIGHVAFREEFLDFASFNTDMLSRGFYFYVIESDNMILRKGKVVKE